MKIEIPNEFNCTVCLDIMRGPVHGCSNGHSVCGTCFGNLGRGQR